MLLQITLAYGVHQPDRVRPAHHFKLSAGGCKRRPCFSAVNTLHRLPAMSEAPVRVTLRAAIRQTQLPHPFGINARALLPDQLHCIWTLPQGDAKFSLHWSAIKRTVSQHCADTSSIKEQSDSGIKRHASSVVKPDSGNRDYCAEWGLGATDVLGLNMGE